MKLPTKSLPKWLLVPPAVAALLLLGTLSMQDGPSRAAVEPAATPAPAPKAASKLPAAPRTPDLWQIASGLLTVLLLGGGGLVALRRFRNGAAPTSGSKLVTLRQTLRVSPRLTVHAFEFDERILLVGDSEKGLALLDSGRLPERVADEAEVAARAAQAEADDEGAVPKDLVIPRPNPAPALRLPKPPVNPAPATDSKPARSNLMADFRSLLQQAGRS